MELIVALLLSVSVSCAAPPYELVEASVSSAEAQRICRENYTDLASVRNAADVAELLKAVSASRSSRFWIGLMNSNAPEWKWSLGDPAFYTANETLYRNWAPKQSQSDCVYMNKTDGLWSADDCRTSRPFVCSNGSAGPVLVQEVKTWREAQTYCRSTHTDLSSVRNPQENQRIRQLLSGAAGVAEAWIGLFWDSWEWSDKSPSSFRNWKPTEPNAYAGPENSTVLVRADGAWEDWPGASLFPFICEDQLVLVSESRSWYEALLYCRRHHVELVSVLGPRVEQRVMRLARRASTPAVWMGLRFYCSANMWLWLSRNGVCYQNWAPGNGSRPLDCSCERRVGAVPSGGDQRWVSLPPTLALNFICSTSA